MGNDPTTEPLLRFSQSDVIVHNKKHRYQGFFNLDEYKVSHLLYNGGSSNVLTREVFERGDAVVLIPYDAKKDRLVLIEQFRPGALRTQKTPWLLEFIAGMFAENENPVDVAIREAKEEANIDISNEKIEKVMQYLSSPGGMSEEIHLFVADVDSENIAGVHGLAEENEDILVHTMTRVDAIELLEQGKINNSATVIGIQWLQLNHLRLQQQWNKNIEAI
jgi:ADP-ribose pyrophosphatase